MSTSIVLIALLQFIEQQQRLVPEPLDDRVAPHGYLLTSYPGLYGIYGNLPWTCNFINDVGKPFNRATKTTQPWPRKSQVKGKGVSVLMFTNGNKDPKA